MALLDQKTKVVDGFSYEVVVTQGQPADTSLTGVAVDHNYPVKPDPAKIYLDVWIIDEVNGITHDHAVFELTDYIKKLSG